MTIYINNELKLKEIEKMQQRSTIPGYIIKVKCLTSDMSIPFRNLSSIKSCTSIAKLVVLETLNMIWKKVNSAQEV